MSALAALADAGIHADREGLHVMPPDQLQSSQQMQEECKEFLSKTKQFNDIVGDFIGVRRHRALLHAVRADKCGCRTDQCSPCRTRAGRSHPRLA